MLLLMYAHNSAPNITVEYTHACMSLGHRDYVMNYGDHMTCLLLASSGALIEVQLFTSTGSEP